MKLLNWFLSAGALVMLVVAGAGVASAVTVSLSQCNIACGPVAPVTVDYTLSGGVATFHVYATNANFYLWNAAGAFFGFQTADPSAYTISPSTPTLFDWGSGQFDGFGTFNHRVDLPPGSNGQSPPAAYPELYFTVSGITGSLLENSDGHLFAAHFGCESGNAYCSGRTGVAVPEGGQPPQSIPEPATYMLLGAGLLGLGLLKRRKAGRA